MTEFLGGLDPGSILEILANPTSNLTAAAILLAAIVLLLLMAVTALGLLLLRRPTRPTSARLAVEPVREERPTLTPRESLMGVLRWSLLVVLLLILLSRVGTSDAVCTSCHAVGDPEEGTVLARESHPFAACVDCHTPPVVGGRVILALQVLADADARFLGGDSGVSAVPSSYACLACHDEIMDTLAGARVRVSHSEFAVGRGFRCIDCHRSAGHIAQGGPGDRPSMTLCLRCHNDTDVSSECATCHVGDVAGANGISIMDYPKVTLGPVTTCRGCHPLETCNDCHGLELPHPADFDRGEVHGPLAAFSRRKVCDRCHQPAECATACHSGASDPSKAHVANWNKLHGASGSRETQQMCRVCHLKTDFSCNMCHLGYPEP